MKQTVAVGISGVVVVLALISGTLVMLHNHHATSTTGASDSASGSDSDTKTYKTTKQGDVMDLQQTDETVGTGTEAAAGTTVSVNYVGTLTDGTKFDSSYDRNQPFSFTLGGGQVIKGWDQGVVGMKVGGKRKLVIPPSLGYGDQAVSSIPANSTLVFEIELLDVK